MIDDDQRAAQEHHGEASLGEAQSSNPPLDPEMLRDEAGDAAGEDDGPTPERLDEDPAYEPPEGLKDLKGG